MTALPISTAGPEAEDEIKKLQVYFKSLPVDDQAWIRKQAEEEAEGSLFYAGLSAETKQDWIAGCINNILKDKIAQDKKGIVSHLETEKGQGRWGIRATKKSVKERKVDEENKMGAGVSPAYAGVKVTYQNPSAQEVKIAGDWNGWQGEIMTRDTLAGAGSRESGTWYKLLDLRPGEYRYKLVVDGIWQANPDGEQAGDSFGNNLLRVKAEGLDRKVVAG